MNRISVAQKCDAKEDDSSNAAWDIKIKMNNKRSCQIIKHQTPLQGLGVKH